MLTRGIFLLALIVSTLTPAAGETKIVDRQTTLKPPPQRGYSKFSCYEALGRVLRASQDLKHPLGSSRETFSTTWNGFLKKYPEVRRKPLGAILEWYGAKGTSWEHYTLQPHLSEWLKSMGNLDKDRIETLKFLWKDFTRSQRASYLSSLIDVIDNSPLMHVFMDTAEMRADLDLLRELNIPAESQQHFNVLWQALSRDEKHAFLLLTLEGDLPGVLEDYWAIQNHLVTVPKHAPKKNLLAVSGAEDASNPFNSVTGEKTHYSHEVEKKRPTTRKIGPFKFEVHEKYREIDRVYEVDQIIFDMGTRKYEPYREDAERLTDDLVLKKFSEAVKESSADEVDFFINILYPGRMRGRKEYYKFADEGRASREIAGIEQVAWGGLNLLSKVSGGPTVQQIRSFRDVLKKQTIRIGIDGKYYSADLLKIFAHLDAMERLAQRPPL